LVTEAWNRGRKVAEPLESAALFAGCLRSWALGHLGPGVDYERLADLAGRVVAAAPIAGVPLFAAWSVLPEPEEPSALALYRLNLLRELRGGLHGAAVIAGGLTPLEAVMVKTPYFASLYGWPEPWPDPEQHRAAWERAEAATNAAAARAFTGLEAGERQEFVELAGAAQAGAT
jgi:hypothetical protein